MQIADCVSGSGGSGDTGDPHGLPTLGSSALWHTPRWSLLPLLSTVLSRWVLSQQFSCCGHWCTPTGWGCGHLPAPLGALGVFFMEQSSWPQAVHLCPACPYTPGSFPTRGCQWRERQSCLWRQGGQTGGRGGLGAGWGLPWAPPVLLRGARHSAGHRRGVLQASGPAGGGYPLALPKGKGSEGGQGTRD